MKIKEKCPFCGSDNIGYESIHSRAKACVCLSCNAAGPMATTKPDAIRLWNERP